MKQTKYWWQSKTVWLNVATAIVAFGGTALDVDFIKANPQAVGYIVALVAFANTYLRLTTNKVIVPKEDSNA